ncbi:hypothetical protein CCH79_00007493 [Gambusia affinis]|uniref:C-type lectin domain-containing protein n=1 Tax=Gambusia affinis TaxID=33528 RepID=A0A315WCI6_GAMAF|nr:hypothetical protein CCH79_00007493 [Gambusia affinis]
MAHPPQERSDCEKCVGEGMQKLLDSSSPGVDLDTPGLSERMDSLSDLSVSRGMTKCRTDDIEEQGLNVIYRNTHSPTYEPLRRDAIGHAACRLSQHWALSSVKSDQDKTIAKVTAQLESIPLSGLSSSTLQSKHCWHRSNTVPFHGLLLLLLTDIEQAEVNTGRYPKGKSTTIYLSKEGEERDEMKTGRPVPVLPQPKSDQIFISSLVTHALQQVLIACDGNQLDDTVPVSSCREKLNSCSIHQRTSGSKTPKAIRCDAPNNSFYKETALPKSHSNLSSTQLFPLQLQVQKSAPTPSYPELKEIKVMMESREKRESMERMDHQDRRKGKDATDPSSFGFGEDVRTQWKDHNENLLNLVSLKAAESEDLGVPGEPGLKGEVGPKGKMGPIGEKGDKGPKGFDGPVGLKGQTGATCDCGRYRKVVGQLDENLGKLRNTVKFVKNVVLGLKETEDRYYLLVKEPKKFREASMNCKLRGGTLAMPKTIDINRFMADYISQAGLTRVYVGVQAQSKGTDGIGRSYIYADSTPLREFAVWSQEEQLYSTSSPATNVSCVELLNTGTWNRVECETPLMKLKEGFLDLETSLPSLNASSLSKEWQLHLSNLFGGYMTPKEFLPLLPVDRVRAREEEKGRQIEDR